MESALSMQADIKPLVPAELAELRGQIDRIDAEIMEALARRFAVTNNVGQLKATYALNSVDPVREQEKLQQLRQMAAERGLSSDFVHDLFQYIFNEVVKNHRSFLTK
jgi:chorismate mutase